MENKVTARLYKDEKYFDLIEVNESEVEAVKETNRLLWRGIDKEKRQKRIKEEVGIEFCSLEKYQEMDDSIEDDTYPSPEDQMIEEEENNERYLLVCQMLKTLNEKQRKVIELRFFKDMKFADIASELGVSLGTIQNYLKTSFKKMKKVYENMLKTPSKNSFNSEGVKNLSNTRRAD